MFPDYLPCGGVPGAETPRTIISRSTVVSGGVFKFWNFLGERGIRVTQRVDLNPYVSVSPPGVGVWVFGFEWAGGFGGESWNSTS